MKRICVLTLVLLLCAAFAFPLLSAEIGRKKADVTVTERTVFGDRTYADGVTVMTMSHYDRHLFWKTRYSIGEKPTVTSEYEFSLQERREEHERVYHGLLLDFGPIYGFDTTLSAEECEGLQKAYRELFDATAPGTKGTAKVRLQDYYEYYPFRISVHLPGTVWQGNDYAKLTADYCADERTVWDAFRSFFRIPIPEDLPEFEISVTKDENGKLTSFGNEALSWELSGATVSTYTSERCYFAISNRFAGKYDDLVTYADFSEVPGGYGIYGFSYRDVSSLPGAGTNPSVFHPAYLTGVDSTSLEMVYPLGEDAVVVDMKLSEDGTKLLLFTKENDISYLTVLDAATATELQKIEIGREQNYLISMQDGVIVLNGQRKISVVSQTEDGAYRLAFIAEKETDLDVCRSPDTEVLFDGERLVLVDGFWVDPYGGLLCGFGIAVYTEAGLMYYGEYESSLSATFNDLQYDFNCLPLDRSAEFD